MWRRSKGHELASTLGELEYRQGAAERLKEARILLEQQAFAGSVYLAGRAVEGMLRALIGRHDPEIRTGRKSLETGHDLRILLSLVRNLGVIRDFEVHAELSSALHRIARLWSNNMRFWPTAKLRRFWREIRETGRKRSPKRAAAEYYSDCSEIVRRCEILCEA